MSTAHPDPAAPVEGVRLHDLTARRGDVLALDHVTCALPAGAVTAVVGGNGSGKSTLLELLAGVLEGSGGRVEGLPGARALVVQRTEVDRLPLTGRQTVAMGLWRERGLLGRIGADGRHRIDAALAAVGMEELGKRQLSTMSGGQRQRVLVAQGLVQRAPLLLLDEPAAAADAEGRARIDAALAAAAGEGAVVVIATHDRASLASADRAILLDRGRLVAEGDPAEVAEAQASLAAASFAPAVLSSGGYASTQGERAPRASDQRRGGAVEVRTTSSGA
ncbi:ATP-binding cassette domain-containing protein [Agrococcus sp. ARC_14]|uniref:metal ABC transporter ATP-binding protein n=1 Tax=Agrococcus sp. ARC_14 TaxID=2919927 RepID=UPI001F06DE7D|nr:ATP-binding cassette domain-containing protein [Agrococcus sp. ARC_14]MCH1881665.1 ATP-binding cassette domain-containing protein [Agrococcus sp. ARC_14]